MQFLFALVDTGDSRGLLLRLIHPQNNDCFHLQDANSPTAVLVAYVTPETAVEAALLAAARAKLPAYMVPSAIVKLAELPRLASGKVLNSCLPAVSVLLLTAQHHL